jgi:ribosome-associated heat shock protein Hsp15
MDPAQHGNKKIRLDKWLWAARFFKTRSLAKQAIEGGKVRYEGDRVKVSKELAVDTVLQIRQGWDEKTVIVKALSDQRRSASEAAMLYEETAESIELRLQKSAERKALNAGQSYQNARPNKKDRRQIHRFKQQDYE